VVVAIWGTTWVAIKATVATVPPITASGLRFAIAFPVLALLVARMPGVPLRYPPGHRQHFALLTVGYLVTFNALPMGLAGLLLCGAGVLLEHPDPAAVSADSLLAVLYLGAIASVVGFLAYFQLLRELGPVPLSLVFVLFPLLAQVAGRAFGERAMGAGSLGLLVLVLAASLVALTERRAPRAAPAPRVALAAR
jgi:drug/metabolite transporter (DMT)-like permease